MIDFGNALGHVLPRMYGDRDSELIEMLHHVMAARDPRDNKPGLFERRFCDL